MKDIEIKYITEKEIKKIAWQNVKEAPKGKKMELWSSNPLKKENFIL